MSTPIETNTEELQEILQTVYNLPLAGGSGDSYDLIIPIYSSVSYGTGSLVPGDIGEVDWDAVTATKTKLDNGENVRVLVKGHYCVDSGGYQPVNIFPVSVISYSDFQLYVDILVGNYNGVNSVAHIVFETTTQQVFTQCWEMSLTQR
jgi:hypothetical protein